MKVYRYLSQEELKKILNNDIESLGTYGKKYEIYNSHHYKSEEKYLHFFKKKSAMEHIRNIYRKLDDDFYFCTFDIPIVKLALHFGRGCYYGYGYDYDCEYELEFALPVSQFKSEWLKSFEKDERNRSSSQIIKEDNESIETLIDKVKCNQLKEDESIELEK